jgi:hypothetical protein
MNRRESLQIIHSMAMATLLKTDLRSIIKREIHQTGEKIPIIGNGNMANF